MAIVLRLNAVINKVGISRSTIYALCKQDKFPQPIQITERCVGWVESDIDAWLDQRISRKTLH